MRQRIFAWALARFSQGYEQFVAPYKQRLFAELRGTVVELGPGTGVNLRYLDREAVRWIGVDPNPFMRPLVDGCNPCCETAVELEHAGFAAVEYEAMVAPLPVVSPQIVGVASKSG